VFRSGNVLMMWSGPPHEFMNGLLEQMKLDRDAFRKVYGMRRSSRITTSSA
jgi:hypothetical protein